MKSRRAALIITTGAAVSATVAFVVGRRFGMQEREFLVPTGAVAQISFASRRVAINKSGHWDLVFEARNGYDRLLEAQAA